MAFLLICVLGCARCATGASRTAAVRGKHIEVLAVWSGTEQENFQRVLRAFEARTGVTVTYTSAGHSVPDTLTSRFAAGHPPDVAFIPQPGLLPAYATAHHLVALDSPTRAAVAANYDAVWRQLGSLDGRLYGVWFKAANKSLIWYNVGVFERTGVVPPTDIDGLLIDAARLAASGVPAFSIAGGDPWTLTDWFENLYVRVAGPARYSLLARHQIAWTDPTVIETLRLYDKVLDPRFISGGVAGAVNTRYEASVVQTFAPSPAASMVFEGDFVNGVIQGSTHAKMGVDADVFPFPAVGPSGPTVVGGGDLAVLMRDSSAGAALVRYLASPEAGTVWARQGGFISPNRNVDLSAYPDDITRSLARALLEAGDDFRFDMSDLQPAPFGSASNTGMRGRLRDLLITHDVEGTAAALEADARNAYGA